MLPCISPVIIIIIIRVLLTSAPGAFFKQFKIRNYSLRKSNILIYNVLITQISIKIYYLKLLKSAPVALVNISLIIIIIIIADFLRFG